MNYKMKSEESEPLFCDIKCNKAREIMKKFKGMEQFHIIDTRSAGMYRLGHLKGALLLDAFQTNFNRLLEHLPKDHIYLVYCTAGIRSSKAISIMKKLGFKSVYHLSKGLEGCKL